MAEPASISTGIAERYAAAVFELAREDGALAKVHDDLDALDAALKESDDLRRLIHSPIYGREAQKSAIGAVADKMSLHHVVGNALRLMASKRRLFTLPDVIRQVRERIARENGEITADVTTAKALSDGQRDKLAETLRQSVGRDVNLNIAVDESLIGGLIVRVGSKMIDTSIRSKLNQLQNNMKEVG